MSKNTLVEEICTDLQIIKPYRYGASEECILSIVLNEVLLKPISDDKKISYINRLIEHGANVNFSSVDGYTKEKMSTPTDTSLRSSFKVISTMLSYWGIVSERGLQELVIYNPIIPIYAKIQFLIDSGVDINIAGEKGNILHGIVIGTNAVMFLLKCGVDPNCSGLQT